jgi:hypothetical protein
MKAFLVSLAGFLFILFRHYCTAHAAFMAGRLTDGDSPPGLFGPESVAFWVPALGALATWIGPQAWTQVQKVMVIVQHIWQTYQAAHGQADPSIPAPPCVTGVCAFSGGAGAALIEVLKGMATKMPEVPKP